MGKIGLLIAGCLMSVSVLADAFTDLKKQLDAFTTFQAHFEQKTFDEKGFELQQLNGQLKLEKPARFYWESAEPFAQQLVCDGSTIWHFDADLEQVVIQQYADQAQQAPILVMLDDVDSLKKSFTVDEIENTAEMQRFRLRARNDDDPLKAVSLGFSDGKLVSLAFTDNLGQKTHIAFSDVVVNQAVATAQFTFTIPDGADVLHQ